LCEGLFASELHLQVLPKPTSTVTKTSALNPAWNVNSRVFGNGFEADKLLR
jgi:hypothetical protein